MPITFHTYIQQQRVVLIDPKAQHLPETIQHCRQLVLFHTYTHIKRPFACDTNFDIGTNTHVLTYPSHVIGKSHQRNRQ